MNIENDIEIELQYIYIDFIQIAENNNKPNDIKMTI